MDLLIWPILTVYDKKYFYILQLFQIVRKTATAAYGIKK